MFVGNRLYPFEESSVSPLLNNYNTLSPFGEHFGEREPIFAKLVAAVTTYQSKEEVTFRKGKVGSSSARSCK